MLEGQPQIRAEGLLAACAGPEVAALRYVVIGEALESTGMIQNGDF